MKLLTVMVRVRNELPLVPWFLANVQFADHIYVLDTGSTDGTYEHLVTRAGVDSKLTVSRWDKDREPFFDEPDQTRALFDLTKGERYGWYFFLDVDEIPNILISTSLRRYLTGISRSRRRRPHIGIEMPFLYFCPGWCQYYPQVSEYPIQRLWNYLPAVSSDQRGDRVLQLADQVISSPSWMILQHFNWALEERFAAKRKLYERRFGEPSWHPDQRFPEHQVLPDDCKWYSPIGKICSPEEMPVQYKRFAELVK